MSRALMKIVILYGIMSWTCGAQDAKNGPAFEVASVKPAEPPSPGQYGFRSDGARFEASNGTLTSLISFAYGIRWDSMIRKWSQSTN